jgi:hypothetical protein
MIMQFVINPMTKLWNFIGEQVDAAMRVEHDRLLNEATNLIRAGNHAKDLYIEQDHTGKQTMRVRPAVVPGNVPPKQTADIDILRELDNLRQRVIAIEGELLREAAK